MESEGSSKINSTSGYSLSRLKVSEYCDFAETLVYTIFLMSPLITILIRLLTGAFIAGCAGCALLIPVVAFKFAAVLFEPDPASDTAAAE
jgi:hypothetical protein